MSVEAAQSLIAQALGCDTVAAGAGIGTLPEWDSMGHMHIVLAVEAHIGAQLAPEDIAMIATVADVAALLER